MRINERTARFFQKLRTIDGVKVKYQQGERTLENLKALRDTTDTGATDAQGVALNRDTMTWAFWRPDLDNITPEIGDRITEANGERWEVIKGHNDRPYALEEVDAAIITIFTQKVKK